MSTRDNWTTTSAAIAKALERPHHRVLARIRQHLAKLEEMPPPSWPGGYSALYRFVDVVEEGRRRTVCHMGFPGAFMLASAFRGRKAARWRERCIVEASQHPETSARMSHACVAVTQGTRRRP